MLDIGLKYLQIFPLQFYIDVRHLDPRELHQRSDPRSPGYDHVYMMGSLKMFYELPHFVAHSIRPCVGFTVIGPAALLIRQHRTSRPAFAIHGGCIDFWSGTTTTSRFFPVWTAGGSHFHPTTQIHRVSRCASVTSIHDPLGQVSVPGIPPTFSYITTSPYQLEKENWCSMLLL